MRSLPESSLRLIDGADSRKSSVPGGADPQQVLAAGRKREMDAAPAPSPDVDLGLRDFVVGRADIAQHTDERGGVAANVHKGADGRAGIFEQAVDHPGLAEHEVHNDPHRESVLELFDAFLAEDCGDPELAVELYEKALAIDPGLAAAHLNLGCICFHRKDFAGAEDHYRKATEIDPDYVLAFYNLGNVFDELGRLNEAMEAYQRALALNPNHADSHYNLALIYHIAGNPKAVTLAITHLRKYIRLDRYSVWNERACKLLDDLRSKA